MHTVITPGRKPISTPQTASPLLFTESCTPGQKDLGIVHLIHFHMMVLTGSIIHTQLQATNSQECLGLLGDWAQDSIMPHLHMHLRSSTDGTTGTAGVSRVSCRNGYLEPTQTMALLSSALAILDRQPGVDSALQTTPLQVIDPIWLLIIQISRYLPLLHPRQLLRDRARAILLTSLHCTITMTG